MEAVTPVVTELTGHEFARIASGPESQWFSGPIVSLNGKIYLANLLERVILWTLGWALLDQSVV